MSVELTSGIQEVKEKTGLEYIFHKYLSIFKNNLKRDFYLA